jgi:hypothetical protein
MTTNYLNDVAFSDLKAAFVEKITEYITFIEEIMNFDIVYIKYKDSIDKLNLLMDSIYNFLKFILTKFVDELSISTTSSPMNIRQLFDDYDDYLKNIITKHSLNMIDNYMVKDRYIDDFENIRRMLDYEIKGVGSKKSYDKELKSLEMQLKNADMEIINFEINNPKIYNNKINNKSENLSENQPIIQTSEYLNCAFWPTKLIEYRRYRLFYKLQKSLYISNLKDILTVIKDERPTYDDIINFFDVLKKTTSQVFLRFVAEFGSKFQSDKMTEDELYEFIIYTIYLMYEQNNGLYTDITRKTELDFYVTVYSNIIIAHSNNNTIEKLKKIDVNDFSTLIYPKITRPDLLKKYIDNLVEIMTNYMETNPLTLPSDEDFYAIDNNDITMKMNEVLNLNLIYLRIEKDTTITNEVRLKKLNVQNDKIQKMIDSIRSTKFGYFINNHTRTYEELITMTKYSYGVQYVNQRSYIMFLLNTRQNMFLNRSTLQRQIASIYQLPYEEENRKVTIISSSYNRSVPLFVMNVSLIARYKVSKEYISRISDRYTVKWFANNEEITQNLAALMNISFENNQETIKIYYPQYETVNYHCEIEIDGKVIKSSTCTIEVKNKCAISNKLYSAAENMKYLDAENGQQYINSLQCEFETNFNNGLSLIHQQYYPNGVISLQHVMIDYQTIYNLRIKFEIESLRRITTDKYDDIVYSVDQMITLPLKEISRFFVDNGDQKLRLDSKKTLINLINNMNLNLDVDENSYKVNIVKFVVQKNIVNIVSQFSIIYKNIIDTVFDPEQFSLKTSDRRQRDNDTSYQSNNILQITKEDWACNKSIESIDDVAIRYAYMKQIASINDISKLSYVEFINIMISCSDMEMLCENVDSVKTMYILCRKYISALKLYFEQTHDSYQIGSIINNDLNPIEQNKRDETIQIIKQFSNKFAQFMIDIAYRIQYKRLNEYDPRIFNRLLNVSEVFGLTPYVNNTVKTSRQSVIDETFMPRNISYIDIYSEIYRLPRLYCVYMKQGDKFTVLDASVLNNPLVYINNTKINTLIVRVEKGAVVKSYTKYFKESIDKLYSLASMLNRNGEYNINAMGPFDSDKYILNQMIFICDVLNSIIVEGTLSL